MKVYIKNSLLEARYGGSCLQSQLLGRQRQFKAIPGQKKKKLIRPYLNKQARYGGTHL
jgi:hypothetical protein